MRRPPFAAPVLLAMVFVVGVATGQLGRGLAAGLGLAPTPAPAATSAAQPAPPAGYPSEGPGTRPKDGWGSPAPGTPAPTPESTPTPDDTPTPLRTPTREAADTPTVSPTATAEKRASLFEDGATMVAVYGRGFKIAPILGFLGQYKGYEEMDRDVKKRFHPLIQEQNGGKPIVPAVHLIYALAIPCSEDDDCLLYLEETGVDIVKEYIEPAQTMGWHVILDAQMGRSDPVTQVKRMIDRGYLKYEHVHVALDPEFKVYPERQLPGTPVGQLDARDINRAMELLDQHARQVGLQRKKMFMVHQFGDPEVDDSVPSMILNKKELKAPATIDLVLDADGFGGPEPKVSKYNQMLDDRVYPFIQYRGIKLFLPNREAPDHYDKPQLGWPTVFGKKDTPGGQRVRWPPNVIVIA
ncbi:MAG TPA: hypothetical protein VG370_32115 [Chloroflexota bacterium]|nr:hypothetical protein [Chloroflexota bacterium]